MFKWRQVAKFVFQKKKKKRLVWGRHTLIGNVKTWRICAVFLRANIFCTEGSYVTNIWINFMTLNRLNTALFSPNPNEGTGIKAATESSSLYIKTNIHV